MMKKITKDNSKKCAKTDNDPIRKLIGGISPEMSDFMPWFKEEDNHEDGPFGRFVQVWDMKWLDYVYSFDIRTAVYLTAIREIFYRVITSDDKYCKVVVEEVTDLANGLRSVLRENEKRGAN